MGMDFDMDDNEDEQVVKEEEKPKVGKKSGRAGAKKTEANDDKKGTSVGGSGRKRRKVKKSKMEMDDKGYMGMSQSIITHLVHRYHILLPRQRIIRLLVPMLLFTRYPSCRSVLPEAKYRSSS